MAAHQMAAEIQQELRRMPGNNRCVDCDAPYPQWATVSYGTFMCLECSGRHRGLGVHISFVRSVTMDSWTDKQVAQMQFGGNERFIQAFSAANVPKDLTISQKYHTPQAEAYRKALLERIEANEHTSMIKLPQYVATTASNTSSGHGLDAMGVEALKGESEADYVARQMRLREEAKSRMAAKFGAGGLQGIGSSGETRAPQSSSSGGLTDLSSAFGFLSTTVTSAASLVKDQDIGSKVTNGWSTITSVVSDPALTTNVKSTVGSGWSTLSSSASSFWGTATAAASGYTGNSDTNDLSDILKQNSELKSSGKYSGLGNSTGIDNTSYNQGASKAQEKDDDVWLREQMAQKQQQNISRTASLDKNSDLDTSIAKVEVPLQRSTSTAKKEKKKDVDFFSEFGC